MTNPFLINCQWIEPVGSIPEEAVTSALIEIRAGDEILTTANNDFSKSVTHQAVLSAYPVACWFASSWWRLRWECAPLSGRPLSWRMAHQLAAAGGGFIWPKLEFDSAEETIRVLARAGKAIETEPVRYLANGEFWIDSQLFESVIFQFVDLVCARLADCGLADTLLHNLWAELNSEFSDAHLSIHRKIEAILGYDAGDAPEDVLEVFTSISTRIGGHARDELAHVASGEADPVASLRHILELENQAGLRGRIELNPYPLNISSQLPWMRGYAVARDARNRIGQPSGPISNDALGGILGISGREIEFGQRIENAKAGIAIRSEGNARFAFRKEGGAYRRNEAARILGDHLASASGEGWLIESDAKSGRQQYQRAFAAEFLCPIDSLVERLQNDYSDNNIESASDYFNVNETMVRWQLINSRPEGMPYLRAYG